MDMKNDESRLERWRLSTPLLRSVAIVLPILFLSIIDILRHAVFAEPSHTLPGFLTTHSIIAIGIVLFAYTMFGLITSLQARVSEQNRRLSAINAIAIASAQKLRLEELLETGLDHVTKIMKSDASLICLVDLEQEEHSVVCHRGFSPELVRRIQRAKLRDDPVAEEVVRTGRPVTMQRVFDNPRVAESAKREGIRSAISVPLQSEGEVNGILAVATREEHHFTTADEEFLTAIGGQLGMAIRNAVLLDRSQRRNRELAALVAVGKAVTSSLDLDELLSKSLDTIIEITSADAAEIWLPDEEGLVMWGHRGAHPEAFLERRCFAVGEGFPGIVAQSQTVLLVHDLPSDPRFLRSEVIQAGYHTFCALPLRYQNRLVGVLAVAALSSNALRTPGEVHLLEAIGERVATAIANARLHQQVQHLAVQQERGRIAREMHDGMAQVLAYVNAQTLAVKKLLSDGRVVEGNEELARMQETVRQLYADVREGILGLRMASRMGQGLLPALKEYLEQYQDMCGIEVHFEASPETSLRISPPAELQLMRIVQEALSNVRKYASASAVEVTLIQNGNELLVEVTDNGLGFDPTHLPPTGWPRFGLQTMRERAEAVGGHFVIESKPGQGTRVVVGVPLP
ncbi:MAG: GAF domain-containing sensor histidine kinase [Candidatus Tectomicrobia bacterium]|nr:GAF domain-containing sensor histidine kinase [Candidatus Tectomicrobia bacterium]